MTRLGVLAVLFSRSLDLFPGGPSGAKTGSRRPPMKAAAAAILKTMKLIAALMVMVSVGRTEAADFGSAARPVYRGFERVADAAYGVVRGHLFSALLPGRLSSRMSAVPVGSSEQVFAELLEKRQERVSRRILEARPIGPAGPAELRAWQKTALGLHTQALTDAMAGALVKRYQLEKFGRESGDYASDIANWDAEFIASAGVLGSAYLYVAGVRTDWTMGPVRVDFDTCTGNTLRQALQGGNGRKLADLSLSRAGARRLALVTQWGLEDGRLANQSVGLNYSTRF